MELKRRRDSIFLSAFIFGCVCFLCVGEPAAADITVVINELMASNIDSVADPQDQFDDWIELYNMGDSAVDVGGLYLTDDLSDPRRWQIPMGNPALTTIPARGFLLIWADGDTGDAGLHADFGLSAGGDEVGLFHSDGVALLDSVSFGSQVGDWSYGRYPDGAADLKLLVVPTPGEANIGVSASVVADVQFSHPRGFYETGFTLELTTSTEGAAIYYTFDGRDPLAQSSRGMAGTKYTGPIPISRTTCVRAAAKKTGWLSSQSVTCSYLFLNQVIRQPAQPEGFPSSWGGRTADYAMDPRVVDNPAYRDEIKDDLKSTPSVCIVIPNADFFEGMGIYANPMMSGPQSEQAASIEWIDPATGEDFCINAGIRIHGGPYSRSGNLKNAFRINFRAEYGASKLEFPLFPDTDVDSFDTLALRSIWNYSWTGDSGMSGAASADYLRDAFARDTVRDMGRLTPHGRGVQVYINGLYWGLYIMTERPTEDFAAEHLGGDEDDYDVLEAPSDYGSSTVMDIVAGGEQARAAWNTLFTMANGNLASAQAYGAIHAYIDVPVMIDYMLMIYYVGSRDAPTLLGSDTPRNFYAIRQRDPASPFVIVPWDTEWALEQPTINRVNHVGRANPHVLMDRLATNADFRVLLADRIYHHFYNGGTLTRESTTQRYLNLADQIRGAIVGESARWGDVKRASQPYTREDWQREVDRLVNQYFSGRTQTVLTQLRNRGWYPLVEAPVFQIDGQDQHGGAAPTGAALAMVKSGGGTIWYTLDGSDPRVPGAAAATTDADVALVAVNAAKRVLVPTGAMDSAWRGGADFDDSGWLGGAGGVGYERSTGYEPLFSIDVQSGMYGKNGSCFIRIPFEVSPKDLGAISNLVLRVRYDDGFVAYLNGSEVARRNAAGEPVWNSRASAGHDDLEALNFEEILISQHVSEVRAGRNILALHGLNDSTSSSDFLVSVELVGSAGGGGTPDGVAPAAVQYVAPVTLNASVRVKARVFAGTTWSALHEAIFAVGPVAESLRISEIMYHPAETGSPNDPNAEFIELTNVGAETLNLNLVRFTNGVDFTFPSVELTPGGCCLVVKDVAAFETVYSSNLPVVGRYAGSLSNAGERIELQDAAGRVIHSFRFEDNWYKATDGAGFSLTVLDPETVDPTALGDPGSWRPSDEPGGSPGTR